MKDIGIFSWFGYQMPLADRLNRIASAGFTATSLWFGSMEPMFSSGQMDQMVHLARSCGLKIDNAHADFQECNSIWVESGSKAVWALYEYNIELCRSNNIPILVIHVTRGLNPPEMSTVGLNNILELVRLGQQANVIVALENCRRPDYLDFLFSHCDSPYLGLCFDSSHDQLWGNPPTDILRRWGHRVVTVHLSDNLGLKDDHLLPGNGVINWNEIYKNFPCQTYTGTVMLEVVPGSGDQISAETFLKLAFQRGQLIAKKLD